MIGMMGLVVAFVAVFGSVCLVSWLLFRDKSVD